MIVVNTYLKLSLNVKTRSKRKQKKRKKEITTIWNNITKCLRSFNKITSKYRNDGLHLMVQQNVVK